MKSLRETDIQDADGRIVISPGLKVRHKDSQYEYTVDSVTSDEDGKHVVVLNLPEVPRFDTETTDQALPKDTLLSDLADKEVIYEVDPSVVLYEPEESSEENLETGIDYLAVPEEEFEKEYEVN